MRAPRRVRPIVVGLVAAASFALGTRAHAAPPVAPAPTTKTTSEDAGSKAGPLSDLDAGTEKRTMTLAECIATALAHNTDALTSEVDVKGLEAERAGARAGFGPKLHVDGNVQLWNGTFDINLAPGSPPLRARDQFTWTAGVSLIQPLTGLIQTYQQYKVRDFGVDVGKIEREVTRRDVAFRVGEAYLRLLEAQRLAEVARSSVTQLEAQKRQAHVLYENGVIDKSDYLRADLALADANDRVVRSDGNVVLARSNLAILMGASDVAVVPVTPVALEGEPPPPSELTLASAEKHAIEKRAELREVDARIEQADKSVGFARSRLLPQVNLIGNYTHVDGITFQQPDSAYVGANLAWDVWDWGANWHGISAAKANREKAVLARTKIADSLRLEVRKAYVDASTARETLNVSKAALSQAEENYRIVSKRFAENSASSFDNVDAESLLTQTRARVASALYGYHVARLALERAIGETSPSINSAHRQ